MSHLWVSFSLNIPHPMLQGLLFALPLCSHRSQTLSVTFSSVCGVIPILFLLESCRGLLSGLATLTLHPLWSGFCRAVLIQRKCNKWIHCSAHSSATASCCNRVRFQPTSLELPPRSSWAAPGSSLDSDFYLSSGPLAPVTLASLSHSMAGSCLWNIHVDILQISTWLISSPP